MNAVAYRTQRALLLEGHSLHLLAQLEDESVQCCVTSPPYWGLRDYGHKDQIGLEKTPEEYVANLVAVFQEVRRVLRQDGTLWLNLGDCYATGAGKVGECPGGGEQGKRWVDSYQDPKRSAPRPRGPLTQPNRMPIPGLKPKDLVGIPWRVAFALQAAGWYLRADIIWSKPNPMPESVADRPTKAHEYLFLLTKSERYFYDSEAIRERAVCGNHYRTQQDSTQYKGIPPGNRPHKGLYKTADKSGGRNKRSVWDVPVHPFPGAHFATFPPKLIEPCILAGSRPGDTILDVFNGSGTTGVVALKHDRNYIGLELNPEYVVMTVPRLDAEQQQMRLAL